MEYSVLMSVYAKDQPDFLRTAIDSMLCQTVPPAQFVLVCDGPLTPALNEVIEGYGERLEVLRLPVNKGPGFARNHALSHCRCELVAGMDSDDISLPDRCEKQLAAFERDSELAVVSGAIEEFNEDPNEPFAVRRVPLTHEEILQYSKKRIPFNNVTAMFKKAAVEAVGGYNATLRLFEDYDLWIRTLKSGVKTANLPDVLVKVRSTPAQLKRRGGRVYAKSMMRFRRQLLKTGWISRKEYVMSAYPHYIVCISPNGVRRLVYKIIRK